MKTTGNLFNHRHHMLFNCKYGLGIWAAITTGIIYFIYPILCKINESYGGLIIIGMALLFGILNYFILRRGHFKFSFIDVMDISIGFLAGAILSVSILFFASSFNKYGFYPYFDTVKILFFNSIKFYGGELHTFGDEFLIWCFCVVVYILSIKLVNKDKRSSFVQDFDGSGIYRVDINDSFYK